LTAKDFSFTKNSGDDIKTRQAILAVENDEDIECLSNTLKKHRFRILGKSRQLTEITELLRKYKTGVLFFDFDIEALTSETFITSLNVKYPKFKIILLAKTMNKAQLDYVKSHNIKRFLGKPLSTDAINKALS